MKRLNSLIRGSALAAVSLALLSACSTSPTPAPESTASSSVESNQTTATDAVNAQDYLDLATTIRDNSNSAINVWTRSRCDELLAPLPSNCYERLATIAESVEKSKKAYDAATDPKSATYIGEAPDGRIGEKMAQIGKALDDFGPIYKPWADRTCDKNPKAKICADTTTAVYDALAEVQSPAYQIVAGTG